MKTIREIDVKLENRPGTMSELSELLAANGINILALTFRPEGDHGTLCFVANDIAKASNTLESAGYAISERELIAAEVPSHPGGLNAILKSLKLADVNIEYIYSHLGGHGVGTRTILVLGVDKIQPAHDALAKEWIRLYGEEFYTL